MRFAKSILIVVLTLLLSACGTQSPDAAPVSPSIFGSLPMWKVPIGDRTAVYEMVNAAVPTAGDLYVQTEKGDWHLPSGADNLKNLILQDTALAPTLWTFVAFEDPPYTYGEVLEIIYHVHSAEDIASITTRPTKDDNTPEGQLRQEQVGTHTYDSPEDITAFYNIAATVQCLGMDSNTNTDMGRYQDGSITYGRRWLTITLTDGTTIDRWKYDAQPGAFYENMGIGTQPLSAEDAAILNTLFGIS